MIPNSTDILSSKISEKRYPAKTYRICGNGTRIAGHTDEAEAIAQYVYCVLNTERYKHLIYSWDFGVELEDLRGEPPYYAVSELKKRITDALKQNPYISSVDDFNFETRRNKVHVSFTVQSEFGAINAEREVAI